MLDRNENMVMSAVFSLCDGTGGCLVSPVEILSILPVKRKYTPEKVDGILYDLMCDGYFDLITSERKGEKMYVINLKENGYAYKRTSKQRQRDIAFRIVLAFIGAAATFVFGLILKGIFG